MVQYEGGGLFRPVTFDFTKAVEFLQRRDQLALQAAELGLRKQQSDFDRKATEANQQIARAEVDIRRRGVAVAESEAAQKEIEWQTRKLAIEAGVESDRASARESQARAEALEVIAGIASGNSAAVEGATPQQATNLLLGNQAYFGGKSRSAARVSSGVSNPTATAVAPIVDYGLKQLQSTNPLDVAAWAGEMFREGSPWQGQMTASELATARRRAGDGIDSVLEQVNSIPSPSDMVKIEGLSPKEYGPAIEGALQSIEDSSVFIQSQDIWMNGEHSGKASKALNLMLEKHREFSDHRESVRRARSVINGETRTVSSSADLDLFYDTFHRNAVLRGRVDQAYAVVNEYAKAGSLPEKMVADLTGPDVEHSPEALFRLSTFMEELRRDKGEAHPMYRQVAKALAQDDDRFRMVMLGGAFAELRAGVRAVEEGSFDAYVEQVHAKTIAAMGSIDNFVDETSVERSTDGEVVDRIFTDLQRTAVELVNNDRAFKNMVQWDNLSDEERQESRDLYLAEFGYELSKPGSTREAAAVRARETVASSFGDTFMAPGRGVVTKRKLRNPPSRIIEEEYNLPGFEPEMANSLARAQWVSEHPDLEWQNFTAINDYGYKQDGTRGMGYTFVDSKGDVLQVGGTLRTWFPDYSAEAMYGAADDNVKEYLDDYFGVTRFRESEIGWRSAQLASIANQLHGMEPGEDMDTLLKESRRIEGLLTDFSNLSSLEILGMINQFDRYVDPEAKTPTQPPPETKPPTPMEFFLNAIGQ